MRLQIISYPTKTVYEYGEQLDITGFRIQVYTTDKYGNETAENNGVPYEVKDRPDLFRVEGYNSSSVGASELNVVFGFYYPQYQKWLSATENIKVYVNERVTTTAATTTAPETTTTVTTGPKPADYDLGDVNRDKSVNSKDATEILKAYAAFSTGNTPSLTESQKLAADVNKDGSVNAKDASIVLAYYSYLSTGGKKSLTDYMTS